MLDAIICVNNAHLAVLTSVCDLFVLVTMVATVYNEIHKLHSLLLQDYSIVPQQHPMYEQ